jgi:hypothetical protein
MADNTEVFADVTYMLGHRLIRYSRTNCVKIKCLSDLCQLHLHADVSAELSAG